MTGPKPGGPSHPRPTHPPKQTADASVLPTIGMVIRDSERLGAQLLAILNRDIDPASLPPLGLDFHQLDLLRESAGYHIEAALRDLKAISELPLPPVGSAIKLPARQDPDALPRASTVATTGGPGYRNCGRSSALGPCTSRLGHPGPAMPGRHNDTPSWDFPRRGVGPGVLGPT